jgi:LAO/AO transport system kinase
VPRPPSAPLDLDALTAGVLAADRTALGRAITLVESTRPDHHDAAQELLARLLVRAADSAPSIRVGITGVPGSGKSTFVDALGMQLIGKGHRVAVLAVDPSSSRTGGSILGDKTRMSRLATDEHSFIRPSPSAGVLGGVTRATRESIVVLEAAGFDVVFVETIGVGQSETTVASMVDTFVLLMLARTGDTLQGIKKGVLELADVVAVNKADGAHRLEAEGAARELAAALHLVAVEPAADGRPGWSPPVLTCSALEERGLDTVWSQVLAHRAHLERTGTFATRRHRQDVDWMWAMIDEQLLRRFREAPGVRARIGDVESSVRAGTVTPAAAAEQLLGEFGPFSSWAG